MTTSSSKSVNAAPQHALEVALRRKRQFELTARMATRLCLGTERITSAVTMKLMASLVGAALRTEYGIMEEVGGSLRHGATAATLRSYRPGLSGFATGRC